MVLYNSSNVVLFPNVILVNTGLGGGDGGGGGGGGSSSSNLNWILMSRQPHRFTSGQSNSGHKQIYISGGEGSPLLSNSEPEQQLFCQLFFLR